MLSSMKPLWVSSDRVASQSVGRCSSCGGLDAVPGNYEGLRIIGELLGHFLAVDSSLVIDLRRLKGDCVVIGQEGIPLAHNYVVLFNEGGDCLLIWRERYPATEQNGHKRYCADSEHQDSG